MMQTCQRIAQFIDDPKGNILSKYFPWNIILNRSKSPGDTCTGSNLKADLMSVFANQSTEVLT